MRNFSFMLCGVGIAFFAVGIAIESYGWWGASAIFLMIAWLLIYLDSLGCE